MSTALRCDLSTRPHTEEPNTKSRCHSYSGGHGPGKHIALHGTFRLSEDMLG